MKTLVLSIVAACLALPSIAHAQAVKSCTEWQEAAKYAMEMRQLGVPQREVLQTAVNAMQEVGGEPHEIDFLKQIVFNAFRKPVERSERGAEAATIEYGEEILTLCAPHLRL
ncbi:hypothetical protein [Paracoccus sulfuroxidans]|uniref:HdeA/HdeB family protein n=1 Tax=Paracoccus sulfuroxidans TaxID=384678 RepID=A0A562NAK9_9RHOB|nr:hypothetical protein [Paracoccus sulfuroxidans]TWI29232.1 hypothetical protein IQ24_03711 [Paracoccus sulfuroxidans]